MDEKERKVQETNIREYMLKKSAFFATNTIFSENIKTTSEKWHIRLIVSIYVHDNNDTNVCWSYIKAMIFYVCVDWWLHWFRSDPNMISHYYVVLPGFSLIRTRGTWPVSTLKQWFKWHLFIHAGFRSIEYILMSDFEFDGRDTNRLVRETERSLKTNHEFERPRCEVVSRHCIDEDSSRRGYF